MSPRHDDDPPPRAPRRAPARASGLRAATVELLDLGGVRALAIDIAVDEKGAALDALTEAERAVALLVADGLSNKEIGLARGASDRTVANQIASILKKLGVKNRVELTRAITGAG